MKNAYDTAMACWIVTVYLNMPCYPVLDMAHCCNNTLHMIGLCRILNLSDVSSIRWTKLLLNIIDLL